MFSLIFFGIVAFILIVGMVVTAMRKKSRALPERPDEETSYKKGSPREADRPLRSRSAFNERTIGNPGSVMPASNKNLPPDSSNENDTNANDGPANRPVV
ncbi:hypothetical protein [Flavisolibacter ginsenosidimutans]|uniref:Uncharacterized protein n=1 Tax=Flavisolibacter ginsenosidimutans TaxID=661481 RepID=A0A5B8UD93_9BACT|nr:hypothetical protein [Flavisolibacter ginsenosidimutans]QEC54468.1 hypothetical protein FSB75_00665 [Flavisolibacter ginsenosidimutans]